MRATQEMGIFQQPANSMQNDLLEETWFQIRRPSRYLGHELFSTIKDPEEVTLYFALAFPDLYEVGMSYLGMKILYHILNQRPEIWAQRVFTPAPDMARVMEESGILLPALESGRPLKDFHIVGFSLPYELGYTNVLKMLELGEIPLRGDERSESDPLVIAGGPCTYNPEPMADFFDAQVIGDGEQIIEEICNQWLDWKEKQETREALLHRLSSLAGVYVPTVHRGQNQGTAPLRIRKRVVQDLNQTDYPALSPLPYQQIIHDRLSVEIARGCTRGCRFCQAGIIYRPVRDRSPEEVFQKVEEGLKKTGYEEVTLLSLSSGDYTCLNTLLPKLMERWEREKVAVSLPSLRVDTLTPEVMEQILRVRKTGFTIAPEAGTQRLRDVINKNITEEEILQTARTVFSLGWRVLKLYFMIGLPTETEGDLEGLVHLVKKIEREVRQKGRRMEIHVALSTFSPKPHTPFQWAAQLSVEESLSRMSFIRSALNSRHIQVKWNDTRQSFLEGLLARGDRQMGRVLYRAFKKGCLLDGWGEHFSWEKWQEALAEEGRDTRNDLRAKEREENLPWDFIDTGVNKEHLWAEYQKGLEGGSTPDCRHGECNQCGVCPAFKVKPLLFDRFTPPPGQTFRLFPKESARKFRLLISKTGPSRYLGFLEWKQAIIRALRRADLPLVYSEGFHPMPRLSFGPALPVGLSSLGEMIDIQVMDWPKAETIKDLLPGELFPGTKILSLSEIPLNSPMPQPQRYYYQVDLPRKMADTEKLERFQKADHWPIEKPGKNQEPFDLKPLISEMALLPGIPGMMTFSWVLKIGSHGEVRPDAVLQSLWQLPEENLKGLVVNRSLSPVKGEETGL
jgi:radical SAM family uncharacterized protein/radical SAM-linked protein